MSEAARIDLVDRAPLTEKQQNVYESIMQYQRVNGYAPTIREICKMVGVASTSSVYAHLKILEEKGYIDARSPAHARPDGPEPITATLCPFFSLPYFATCRKESHNPGIKSRSAIRRISPAGK